MKKLIGLVLLVFLGAVAWNLFVTPDASTEALLKSIAESEELQVWIDEHPADKLAGDARDTLVTAFPFLEPVLNPDNWKQSLENTGLKLLEQYMADLSPESQEKAENLGRVIKYLMPELSQDVDAILAMSKN